MADAKLVEDVAFWGVSISFLYLVAISVAMRLPRLLWKAYLICLDWFKKGFWNQTDALFVMENTWKRKLILFCLCGGWIVVMLATAAWRGWLH